MLRALASRIAVFVSALSCIVPNMTSAEDVSGIVTYGPQHPLPGPASSGTPINRNVTLDPLPQNETSIAIDPSNPLSLVAGTNDWRNCQGSQACGEAGVAYTTDGGITWFATTLRSISPAFGINNFQGDPAVAAFRSGVFYYAYIDLVAPGAGRLCVAKTTTGGQTWTGPTTVAETPYYLNLWADKPYITVDNTSGPNDGFIYLTYTGFASVLPAPPPNCVLSPSSQSPGRIMLTGSSDGGASFSTPVAISDECDDYQYSTPTVGPDGELYISFLRWINPNTGYILIDRGGTPDVIAAYVDPLPRRGSSVEYIPGTGFRVNSGPTIATDRSPGMTRGNVYVAWADESGVNGSGPDILFAGSSDGGSTWCAPVRVSDDLSGEWQWFPWMTVDDDGNIDIVFYDRRDSPGGTQFNLYHARSTNGGVTFGTNERVTDALSDAVRDGWNFSNDPNYRGSFIGDYNGMATSATTLVPFWTDLRGNSEGFVAGLSTGGPKPCPGETADVLETSMFGYAGSGPQTGTMILHFRFRPRHPADEFKVQWKRVSDPTFSVVTCGEVSPNCRWNCDGTLEATVTYPACAKFQFHWQAQAHNCLGWQAAWSPLKAFSTLCLEEP